jgi:uncharacterized secreted repeat protein (TIGR03808 family)
MTRLTRRHLLAGTAALAALAPASAFAQLTAALARGFALAADFGVTADGTDQSAPLQQAIDAAAAAQLPLLLAGGTYAAANVTLPAGLTLLGLRGATQIQAIGDQPIFLATGATALTLRDFGCDGTTGGGTPDDPALIVLRDCPDLVLENLALTGGLAGLQLERCGGRVTGLDIADMRHDGIFALDSAGLTLTDNRIARCGNGGIRVWASKAGRVDGTRVTGNTIANIRSDGGGNGQNGNGVNVYRAAGVTVSGNRLLSCAFSAIRLNATEDTIVAANTCLDSGEVAIFSEFGFSGSVIADNIVDRAAQGISITNFNEGGRLATCTGNIVRNIAPRSRTNPDTTPIGIAAEADAVIANNVVENVPGTGIAAGWGPYLRDVTVASNVVRDIDIGIAVSVADGAGSAVVTGNRIANARRAALAATAWHDLVSPDLPRDAGRYPKITLSGNSTG